jgi:hypothetical protein
MPALRATRSMRCFSGVNAAIVPASVLPAMPSATPIAATLCAASDTIRKS